MSEPIASSDASAPAPVQTLSYNAPHGGSILFTANAMEMLRQTRPWARLIGILLFVGAGFMVIGGIGMLVLAVVTRGDNGMFFVGPLYVVFAMLYIPPGIYLNRYASRINTLLQYGREDSLEQAMEAQKSFWRFAGVVAVVVIAVYILVIAGALAMAVLA